jgi:hypothetical protein
VALTLGLLTGAGFGGFAIAQAASSGASPDAPMNTAAQNVSSDQNNAGALQAASTPTATPSPKHSCPNMGSHSSSGTGASSSSLTAY